MYIPNVYNGYLYSGIRDDYVLFPVSFTCPANSICVMLFFLGYKEYDKILFKQAVLGYIPT